MFKSFFTKFQAIRVAESKFSKYGRIGFGCALGGFMLYKDTKIYQNAGSTCESAIIARINDTEIDATQMMNDLMNSVRLELGSTVKFSISLNEFDTSFYKGLFRPPLIIIGLWQHAFSKNQDDLNHFLKFVDSSNFSYQKSENIKARVNASVDLADFNLHRAIFKANDQWTIPDYYNVVPFFLPYPLCIAGIYLAGAGLAFSRQREYQADQYAFQKLTPDQRQKVISALDAYQLYVAQTQNAVSQCVDLVYCPSFTARSQRLKTIQQ